jgi:hypothetical protein
VKPRTKKVKICNACKEPQPLTAFAKDASRPDSKMARCRQCDSAKGKAWRVKNKEHCRSYGRAWIASHPEAKLARDKRYREAHPSLSRYKALWDYGLALTWFETRLAELGGRCERCHTQFQGSLDTQVDHDHECCNSRRTCGRCTRGLVCGACNRLMSRTWVAANPTDPYLTRYRQRRATAGTMAVGTDPGHRFRLSKNPHLRA